jgi:hypothetical protein
VIGVISIGANLGCNEQYTYRRSMRLNSDLITSSPAFFNALRERELDLRGSSSSPTRLFVVRASWCACLCFLLHRIHAGVARRFSTASLNVDVVVKPFCLRVRIETFRLCTGNRIPAIENLGVTEVSVRTRLFVRVQLIISIDDLRCGCWSCSD